jgi:hypothetical protein
VTVLLTVLLFILLGLVLFFSIKFQKERAQDSQLWLNISTDDRVRDAALRSGPKEAVGILEFFYLPENNYLSSTDMSPRAKIYRHEREVIIQDIIRYLRQKAGEDLGSDPKKWSEKYDK